MLSAQSDSYSGGPKEIVGQPCGSQWLMRKFSAFFKVIHMPSTNWYCRGAIHIRVCTGAYMNMQVCVQVCLCTWRPVDTPDHCCTDLESINNARLAGE